MKEERETAGEDEGGPRFAWFRRRRRRDRPASAKETKFTRQNAYAPSKTQTKNVAFFSLRIDLLALALPNCFTT